MQTTFTDVNTSEAVIIDSNATEHYMYKYKRFENVGTATISTKCAKIYNSLLQRFIANNFEPITLDMKGYGEISVHAYSDFPVTKLADYEMFEIFGGPSPYLINESLVAIAGKIANWDKICKNTANSKDKCAAFYDKCIKGHTAEQLNIGIDTAIKVHDAEYAAEKANTAFDKDAFLVPFTEQYGISIEEIKECLTLSNNWSSYSDWYKDLHGMRPSFRG